MNSLLLLLGADEDGSEVPSSLVDEVGLLLRARTKTTGGSEVGTFNDETRPTGAQVQKLLDKAAGHAPLRSVATVFERVKAGLSDQQKTDYTTTLSSLVALRTAMLVELSYFPSQVEQGNSPYEELKALYEEDLAAFMAELSDLEDGTAGDGSGMPLGTFPGSTVEVDRVGWATWW